MANTLVPSGDFAEFQRTLSGTTFGIKRQAGILSIRIASDAALALPLDQADPFLKAILGALSQALHVSAQIEWSSDVGLKLDGAPGSVFILPLNQSLGFGELKTLQLRSEVNLPNLKLTAGLSGSGTLGPLVVAFQNLGIVIELKPAGGGQLTLDVSYKAPDGLGVRVEAGPITGGGFLQFDEPNGRYAAVIQVGLFGLGVSAFALIDTRLPGGESGFSFLMLLFADFEAIGGIQLSFGFTLTGVGGLFGIFRTLVQEALRATILRGNLSHILFPQDPVKNATAIISDLREIFPPARDEFVFGPVMRLAWGTPVLAEVVLGFVLSLPRFTIALLGQLGIYLPAKPTPLMEIHIDVVGIVDIPNGRLELTGSMHDSRILYYTLSGDMEFLLSANPPLFLLSLGGFNPHFVPPPGVPQLHRLTLSLGFGDNPRLTMQNYFAVTSNTFQFGASAELYAEAGPFSIRGWLGFDALFSLSPLYFIIDISAGIELRAFGETFAGIHLNAQLSGPSPWHAKGEACVSLFLADACVPFDATVGDSTPASVPPPPDPAPLLAAAISDAHNWSAVAPPNSAQVAAIAPPDVDAHILLLDPVGGAALRQRVLPLNRDINKFAEAPLAAPIRFDLTGVTLNGAPLAGVATERDFFAPGQFTVLSDQDKLSQPSFDKMDAGFSIASNAARGGNSDHGTVDYESDYFEPAERSIYVMSELRFAQMLETSPAANAVVRSAGALKYGAPLNAPRAVTLDDAVYLAATTDTLAARPEIVAYATKSEARLAVSKYVDANPAQRSAIQVMLANSEK